LKCSTSTSVAVFVLTAAGVVLTAGTAAADGPNQPGAWTVTRPTDVASPTAVATPMPSASDPAHPQGWPNGWTVTVPTRTTAHDSVTTAPDPVTTASEASSGRPSTTIHHTGTAARTTTSRGSGQRTRTHRPTAAATAAHRGERTWYVGPGDTLSLVSAVYGVSVDRLAAHNDIANPDLIFIGQVLHIPQDAQ
jgi:LysM repeat protein